MAIIGVVVADRHSQLGMHNIENFGHFLACQCLSDTKLGRYLPPWISHFLALYFSFGRGNGWSNGTSLTKTVTLHKLFSRTEGVAHVLCVQNPSLTNRIEKTP